MSKQVKFGVKPTPKQTQVSADQWVDNRETEKNKRLTIDLPESLHSRIKATCAMRGLKMNEVIRELLEAHFSDEIQTG
jgi:predicted DNA binding CopG/RHH family protein